MNERIKLLAEQATIKTSHRYHTWGDRIATETKEVFDKEKFAELIVQECMNIARNVGNISEPDDWALDRCYEIEQRIQDRFGVEE
jgi:hypothetical protein